MTDRSNFIGSSDAKRILDGDWLTLYEEKLGIRKPEDLTANFPVQLGVFTEKFHRQWLNRFEGFQIREPAGIDQMPGHPMIASHIDGWCNVHASFVELKHSNGRATRDSMVDWYQPQMAHNCNVLNVSHGWLSFIAGNSQPEYFKIEPSIPYRQALLDLELAFWWHIDNHEPPNIVSQETVAIARAAAKEVRLDDMRTVDMHGNNEWASHAVEYQIHEADAARFEAAKKALKGLVEADVRMAHGHGVVIKRSKSGSLLIGG